VQLADNPNSRDLLSQASLAGLTFVPGDVFSVEGERPPSRWFSLLTEDGIGRERGGWRSRRQSASETAPESPARRRRWFDICRERPAVRRIERNPRYDNHVIVTMLRSYEFPDEAARLASRANPSASVRVRATMP
jgi:hypothetical protein